MYFLEIRQKRQYNLKTTIFGRSSPKSTGFLRKHIQIYMQYFKTIRATSFELSRDKKLTTYTHTHTHTHRQTHIHTFPANDFFFNVDHICTKEMAKFDNWFLRPIQGFTNQRLRKQKLYGVSVLAKNFFWLYVAS